jgi:hypothetical protein
MILRRLHGIAAAVFLATIVVQVVLAGLALAELGGSGDFSTHIAFGYEAVGLGALLLVLTALLARRPRRDVLITLGLLAQYIVQTSLPQFRSSIPVVSALHPLNAMLLFLFGAWYARRAWRAGWLSEAVPESPGRAAGPEVVGG